MPTPAEIIARNNKAVLNRQARQDKLEQQSNRGKRRQTGDRRFAAGQQTARSKFTLQALMIVNARMYSVCPAAKEAWRTLIGWVMRRAGVDWQFVDWDPPQLLSELWARDDLGCAMMCGLPYSLREPGALILAAPVPSARWAKVIKTAGIRAD